MKLLGRGICMKSKKNCLIVFMLGISFFLVFSALNARSNQWEPSPGYNQLLIWPKGAPDLQPVKGEEIAETSKSLVAGKPWIAVQRVSNPTMTLYPAKGKNTGVTIVVFPGGGYRVLAIDLEGTEICDYFTSKGITCVLLKYRVPHTGPHWNVKKHRRVFPKIHRALQDAQRTIGLLRHRAKELNINPKKIGVLGFSAGGHLVADLSTHFKKRLYPPVDLADEEICRPDFAIPIYPGHMFEQTTRCYQLNPTIPVTKDTPPTFLLHSGNDPVDDIKNSLVYYIALKKAGVPTEMHIYSHGGHAFGLRSTKFPITKWPQLVETWLKTIGMILD